MTPMIRSLNCFLKRKALKINSKIISMILPTIACSHWICEYLSVLISRTSWFLLAPYPSSQRIIRALSNLGSSENCYEHGEIAESAGMGLRETERCAGRWEVHWGTHLLLLLKCTKLAREAGEGRSQRGKKEGAH